MTGEDMVALFERCGVPRTEITAGMMRAVEFSIKAERDACAKIADERGRQCLDEEDAAEVCAMIAVLIRAR